MEDLTQTEKQAIRERLVIFASKLIDIPYEFGAEWVDFKEIPKALDCSELTQGVYGHIGIKLIDGSQNQYDFTKPSSTYAIGDLCFFGRGGNHSKIYHVGMIYDKDTVIEARAFDPTASFETGKVILRPLVKWMGYKNFCGIRSHPRLV